MSIDLLAKVGRRALSDSASVDSRNSAAIRELIFGQSRGARMHDPDHILSEVRPRLTALRNELSRSRRYIVSVVRDEPSNDWPAEDMRTCGNVDV
jgi:hypothetical protein